MITPQQITLVQSSFEKVLPLSQLIAGLFYSRLFETEPNLRQLFKIDMAEQGQKLMDMLQVMVDGLDRLEEIEPAIAQLGSRHAGYNVKPEHYELLEDALLWTLEQALREDFTDETRTAWKAVYTMLANIMKDAADQTALT
jgi:hemoglobin-like flavoprotein